jgi:hypothetical protein
MISPSSAAQVAFAIDDQDIAGLRHRHRGMNRQIITRTDFNGDGRTRNGHVRASGLMRP